MAISPPSDIVLDVARAVGPTEIEAARAALARRAGAASPAFTIDDTPALSRTTTLSRLTTAGTDSGDATKFKRFEAMVLQTFIQNMLPKDAEGVYGKGLAGDMWKSQMAEHIADVMAERGGIGIARSMLADHYLDGKDKVPIGPVSGGPEKAESDRQAALSTSLVQEIERRMARSMTGNETAAQMKGKV